MKFNSPKPTVHFTVWVFNDVKIHLRGIGIPAFRSGKRVFFRFNRSRPVISVQSLRKVGQDSTVLLICITVFLSYLPEAGQYSSFFLYLKQV